LLFSTACLYVLALFLRGFSYLDQIVVVALAFFRSVGAVSLSGLTEVLVFVFYAGEDGVHALQLVGEGHALYFEVFDLIVVVFDNVFELAALLIKLLFEDDSVLFYNIVSALVKIG
jgi:hypothetical protein